MNNCQRKWLSSLLSVVLIVSMMALSACSAIGGNESAGEPEVDISGKFSVGYGRINITPEESVPLAGAGNTSQRMSKGVLTYLYTTCLAFTDAKGETALVFSCDLQNTWTKVFQELRENLSTELSIPIDHIMVACTHTHSAPDLDNYKEPSIARYFVSLKKWMLKAAKQALSDRRPAEAGTASTKAPGLNFVRHYTTESGINIGDNFGQDVNSPITGHTHPVDDQMQLIKITREGGKDIVLVNWQTHPHRTSDKANGTHYEVSADLVDAMRNKVEKELGCDFIYFTGASGNVNPTSKISEENITNNYLEQGQALAQYAIKALENTQPIELGNIEIASQCYQGQIDHTEDSKVAEAREVASNWAAFNDMKQALALAHQYGINSPYHAQGIVAKAAMGPTCDINLFALKIGKLAFAFAPYEMFDTQGVFIKQNSPFDMTFVCTLANERNSYIPSEEGYESNCYEANTGYFIKGTGEQLADEFIKLLDSLHTK